MFENIRASLGNLSNAERRVAEWVLAHPRQTAEATLAEVAQCAGVSEPTVVRFCRSIGLGGFRELPRRLTEALGRPGSFLHQDVSADDSSADAVIKVFDASIRALVETRAELAQHPFDAGAEMLAAARQIVFIGLGASGNVARDAQHKFFRLGIPCLAITDVPSILQFASIASRGDLLFFISSSGAWEMQVRAANLARGQGATVIAMTRPGSELAAAAALLFPCRPTEDTNIYTPTTSRLAQLALLDALMVLLSLQLGDAAVDRLRASKASIG